MNTALFCNHCNSRLSNWVRPIETVDEMKLVCNIWPDQFEQEIYPVPSVPEGYALHLSGDLLASRKAAVPNWEADQYPRSWLSVSDLLSTVCLESIEDQNDETHSLTSEADKGGKCICGERVGSRRLSQKEAFEVHNLFCADSVNTYWK